nr:hypothetical protein [Tanacetum cinerariifolium]
MLLEQNAAVCTRRRNIVKCLILLVYLVNVVSSFELKEKLSNYENLTERLEEFQDAQLKVVNDKFDKLHADFVEVTLHLEERFYSYLLTTIVGRKWLLTHGMKLAISKCLNSLGYLSALGTAVSKAIEKGLEGTSGAAPATADLTTALSVTLASADTVTPLSVDDYGVMGMDDQSAMNESAVDEDANPFPNVEHL